MLCARCEKNMPRSRHELVEDMNGTLFVTVVYVNECVSCGISNTLLIPLRPDEIASTLTVNF